MDLSVVGVGYVGLVTGACFSDLGNKVLCLDNDEKRISELQQGKLPFYEPQLQELVDRNFKANRLEFTTDMSYAIKNTDICFICVGTPSKPNGDVDMSYVETVAKDLGKFMDHYTIVVNKSTVPVGTAARVKHIINQNQPSPIEFDVVSNPEFLRQGSAVKDFMGPDRIVIGSDSVKATEILERLYKNIARVKKDVFVTDIASSELIKYASNAMLATRISFMNELSYLCHDVGADIKEVQKGMGLDARIGERFLQAGVGYGGSCFPKDVKGLIHVMETQGYPANILRSVDQVNERQKKVAYQMLKKVYPDLKNKTIALWGLSFKPNTDDLREAPSLTLIELLQRDFAKIKVYDPIAMEKAKLQISNVEFNENIYDAAKGADALLVITEWNEFREPDFARIKSSMNKPVLIDGRNIYSRKVMKELGFEHYSIGR